MTRFLGGNAQQTQSGTEDDPAAPPSMLENAANNLDSATDALEHRVDDLVQRLRPVTRPDPVTGVKEVSAQAPRPVVAPFVARLQTQADRVDGLAQRLEALLKQLQV